MNKKIIVFLILTLFLMGFVSAQDLPNFKIPDNFKDVGNGNYVKYDSNNKAEQSIAVIPFSKHSGEDYFENDSDYGYSVNKSRNNIFNYYDNPLKEQGSCEIINASGKLFIVESWEKMGKSDFNTTQNNLIKFNELNEFKPVVVSKVVD